MKTIIEQPIPVPFTGEALTIQERDGELITTKPVTACYAIELVIRNARLQGFADVEHGLRVMEKVRSKPEKVELEDADHAWLMNKLGEVGPSIFRLNTLQVKKILEGADLRTESQPSNGQALGEIPIESRGNP